MLISNFKPNLVDNVHERPHRCTFGITLQKKKPNEDYGDIMARPLMNRLRRESNLIQTVWPNSPALNGWTVR